MFFQNFKETADKLPDDLRLKFYDAMTDYVFNGVEPEDSLINALITAIKPSLDKTDERGGSREGAGAPKGNQNSIKNNQKQSNQSKEIKVNQNNQSFLETETETETRNRSIEKEIVKEKVAKAPTFKKPTLDEVKAYCQERNNGVDAEKWMDHYTANGWKVGKNPMRDWKATVRTWERLENRKPVENKTNEPIKLMDFIDQMERREAMA